MSKTEDREEHIAPKQAFASIAGDRLCPKNL